MKLFITKEAEKQINRFSPPQRGKVKKKLFSLEQNPHIGKKLGGELVGYRTLRAWPYRIIYKINEEKEIVIIRSVLHRQGAYK